MSQYRILSLTPENVEEFGIFCVKNKKHAGYRAKSAWLGDQLPRGLKLVLLLNSQDKAVGFLEYAPSEQSWRPVNAPGYDFIHCIWTDGKKLKTPGLAAKLLQYCIEDASSRGRQGVAVISSTGSWMAGADVFRKHGFDPVDEKPPFSLLAHRFTNSSLPKFPRGLADRSEQYQELTLLYANQCPYVGKAVAELPPVAARFNISLSLVEVTKPKEAQAIFPTPYGVFCLIYEGRVLADHPISATRFRNILQKELNLITTDKQR